MMSVLFVCWARARRWNREKGNCLGISEGKSSKKNKACLTSDKQQEKTPSKIFWLVCKCVCVCKGKSQRFCGKGRRCLFGLICWPGQSVFRNQNRQTQTHQKAALGSLLARYPINPINLGAENSGRGALPGLMRGSRGMLARPV